MSLLLNLMFAAPTWSSRSSTCATQELPAQPRANHSMYAPLGAPESPPEGCELRNYPALVDQEKQGDGDKRLCAGWIARDLQRLDVIVSIGSNNNFDFEEQMVACTSVHIATFDCTVKNATRKPATPRVSFHQYCLGLKDEGAFRTWASIASMALDAASTVHSRVNIATPTRGSKDNIG